MNDLLIVVPARGGSKRLAGKNLRRLVDRSLVEWTAKHVADAELDAPCLLTTDDEAIAETGRQLGWLVPFMRPPELAGDDVPTYPAVIHALDWFAEAHCEPSAVMLLQVTSPLRDGACLRRAVDMLEACPDATAVVGMRELASPADQIFVRNGENFVDAIASERGKQKVLAPNGALYLVRTEILRAHGDFAPPGTIPLVMDSVSSIDIDTQSDWDMAEALLSMRLSGRLMSTTSR